MPFFFQMIALPETNSLPLKTGLLPQKETLVFQASIFRCKLAVSLREGYSAMGEQNYQFKLV